jgi:plastocyanin
LRFRYVAPIAAAVLAVAAPVASAKARTWSMWVGVPPAQAPTQPYLQSFDSDSYYPSGLTVHVGDTVMFHSASFHTASILGSGARPPLFMPGAPATYAGINDFGGNPFYFDGLTKFMYNPTAVGPSASNVVSSKTAFYSTGVIPPPGTPAPAPTLKFTKAGTYTLVCLIHPFMRATVFVVPAKAAIQSPKQQQHNAVVQINTDKLAAAKLASVPLPIPKNTVWMSIGAPVKGGHSRFTLYSVSPAELDIRAGTTVTFRTGAPNEVHNVAISPPSTLLAPIGPTDGWAAVIDAQTDFVPVGPPPVKNQLTPFLIYGSDPSVAGNFTATGPTQHGNGFLATYAFPTPGPLGHANAKITFTQPGVYRFICQIHPFMHGTIVVS